MMEGQENVSTTAAPSSVAREGLLVLPTPEHVGLHQSQPAAGAQQQTVETQIPASAVGPVSRSGFSAVNVEAAAALNCLSSYNEIVGKLNRMWEDQMTVIRNVDDSHWKNPEFPLARIKKIMRMDEEVKMISSEVPLMLSKAVEIFVTELTLRAWLHTEESKRRTVQRSDIAMAITKQDMFDFLIDIVPREEIQLKSKTQSKQGESDQLQLLTPELLQLYLQHISQQQQQTSTNSTTQQPQPQQQQQHHQTSQTLAQLQQLQYSQQQKQQQAQQQIITHQQQQQQLVDTLVGDMDETSVKIFQDNVALLQQLQQLVQLQLQVQQLQEATSASLSGSAGDHTQSRGASIHLPTSEPLTLPHTASHEILVSSVLNQPQQVMATDSIHRVTINAANDMLSDSELHSAISSLSSSSRESLRPASSLLSSLPPSSSSSSSQLRRRMTSVPMVIEPELVETGALANSPSPSSSHDLLDDSTADSATRGLLAGEHVSTQPVADPRSHGPNIQTSSSVPLAVSSASDILTHRVSQGGGAVSTAQLQQLHHQLEPQISNILSQTGTDGSDEPEQYVVQTAPLLELVSSAHTVTINPTSAAVSNGNLTSIVQTGAEIPVATSNQQSSSTLTPINATLDSSDQFLSSIDDSTPMEH